MGQLAIEGELRFEDEPQVDVWAHQRQAGFKELDSRHEHGVEIAVLWRETGNLMLLGAYSDTGVHAITLIDSDSGSAREALEHPTQFLSHEASDRVFNQAA